MPRKKWVDKFNEQRNPELAYLRGEKGSSIELGMSEETKRELAEAGILA